MDLFLTFDRKKNQPLPTCSYISKLNDSSPDGDGYYNRRISFAASGGGWISCGLVENVLSSLIVSKLEHS